MTSLKCNLVSVLPSSILFNSCAVSDPGGDDLAHHTNSPCEKTVRVSQTQMDGFCRRVLQRGEYPRLQVVERDSRLVTLNNTRLGLFQRLQQAGYCRRVKVEVIPLRHIPPGIRDLMCSPVAHRTSGHRTMAGCTSRRGYQLIKPEEESHQLPGLHCPQADDTLVTCPQDGGQALGTLDHDDDVHDDEEELEEDEEDDYEDDDDDDDSSDGDSSETDTESETDLPASREDQRC